MYLATQRKYIKSTLGTTEIIDGRVKIGFVRCPKCNTWLGLYKDEINTHGVTRKIKECKCGFNDKITLEDWDE